MTVPPESAAGLLPGGTQELSQASRVTANGGGDVDDASSPAAPYPLTPLQHGMLFGALVAPAAGVNVEQVVCHLREPVDAERMERAWNATVRRHDVLRTRFRWTDVPEPVQEVLDEVRVGIARDDVAGLAPAAWDARLEGWLAEDRARGFDLGQAPAMRLALFHRAADEHVLVWTFHHILLDVQSITTVLHEAFTRYGAGGDGTDADLPALRPFRDHAAWVHGRDAAADQAFWTARLRELGAPTPVRALRDAPRDPEAEAHFGRRELRLSARADEALYALKRERGINRNKVMQAAWALLLGRYSGSAETVSGLVRAGRGTGVQGSDEMVGLLINTIPVRVPLPPDARVIDVLRELAARNAEVAPYEHAALPDVQRWSGLPQSAALFDTLVNYQPRPFDAPLHEVEGRSFRLLEHPGYPLTLGITGEEPLRAWIDYDAGLFDAASVDRMLDHFARLAEEMAAGPDRRLGDLDPMGEDERRMVVQAWNATEAEYPADRCIHELFEAQAERTPDAVALVHEEESLTYAELNARANRLARHLIGLGVGPEVRVGVCLERGVEMVAALLAVLKAGGAYVPLDPAYPAERLAFMLADAGVAVLLTQDRLRGVLPAQAGVRVVSVDGARQAIAAEPAENPAAAVRPRGLAYLIYTSGSTGVPKGVAIEHGNAAALLGWAWGVYTDEELSGVLASTSIGFDLSVYELFVPLSRGGRVILVENALALPASAAADQVRLVNTVPSAIAALLKSGGIPAGVRTVNLAGEPLKQALVDALYAHGVERVYDLYGPSEDTTYSTGTLRRAGGVANIGRAISNTQCYVLDGALRPVPVGVPGELFLGGKGVTRGYLGRPALTAERYIPDPFGAAAGGRLYRTGDQVRWRADGTLEYMGRLDHQVKIRGFRIEVGEIEAVLRRHPAVADCVVMPRADQAGELRLVAYVAGRMDVDALRGHLRRTLPDHMVPGAFVFLDALPLTPNGKLDRKALPAPELASADAYVAPRTPAEEVLAGVWAEVLGLERVGTAESFVALGGHSLLATRVVSRIRDVLGVELGVRALFDTPTVAALARAVEESRSAHPAQLPPVVPVDRARALPLSFAQERLWFLDQMESGSAFYNIPATLRVRGALDAAALERALGEIVRRHEALRTVFPDAGGGPVQSILPFTGFALPVEDLSGLGDAEREAEAGRRAMEHAARPFDLVAGPLFRAGLLRLGADDHLLLLSIHHVASDGWSFSILFRELSALYAAYADGGESPLRELAVQYADYAVWQREHFRGEALDGQLAYWKDRLAGAPALLELPTDHPRPAVQSFRGAHERMDLSPALLDRLQAVGRHEGATLHMVLLAAFQVLLGKYTGSDDVVVGSPTAGRTRREVEALIGFFVNTLVLRTELGGDPGFSEVLRRVRQTTLGAYEHQDLPFERLVAELEPERSLSHSPLVQVMFALENTDDARGELAGLQVSRADADLPITKFDLTLTVKVGDGAGHCVVEYGSDLFERATIRRMLGHLERVLEQAAARPEARLSELELLSAEERSLVLETWNAGEVEYPADRCIHELVQAQAARTPDAPAIAGGGTSLTCGALNARANRLAHHLVRLGVGPEVRVGVCLERGPELIVSTLAVLKAGGGYVALDPAYPAGRLEMMMRDADAAVLLTHSALTAPPLRDGVHVVRIDEDADAIAAESADDPARGATARNLAYVVYTSGSTGTPKGVAVDHAALGSLCAWHVAAFGITAADRATQVASPGFDAAVWEVWPYLVSGASVQVAPEDLRSDPAGLRDWLVDHRITVSFIPTPVAEPMLALAWPRDTALRWLLTGGDRLRARPAAGMPFALSNNYGPTECTVVATSGVVEAEGVRAPSIGGPIENTRIYVLGAGMRALPAGVPGEMYIGGAQVARGYLNRPGLTAERFVPDPFAADPGARLYRTGDKVRWMADGTLEYLGRLDEQVKVRGFRIELGEIEAVLRRHAAVRDCAVIAHESAGGDRRLAAYVVGDADANALRTHLRATLPDYMVPGAFVFLETLPLTPNGKLDRRALPAPEEEAADAYVAPRTPTEEVLAGVWAEMLGRERVGADENFFDLGGHSLLATRVVSRIREVFGVELSVRVLFEAPTVARLAGLVDDLRRAGVPRMAPLVPVERTGALPLSFAQERLWFLDRMESGSAFYNIPAALRLRGALDAAALERALGEIVRRHEALRTTFPEVGGAPVQAVAEFAGFVLPVEDLSALDDAEREARVRQRAAEDLVRPFDLAAGPVFRAALLRVDAQEHVLLLSMHHIASDGWSVGVLFRELSALYESYENGEESVLPPLPVQYGDFSVWQREQLRGAALDRQLSYWTDRLAGAPALLELPTDRPRPAVHSHRGAQAVVELPAGLRERLEALGRREGVTLYMVLLGAFQLLLARYSGGDDVVVGSPIAGRTRGEVEGLIGFFVNMLPLRTDLGGDPTFRELLGRVREVTLGAYEHQEVPFEKLVEELQPERSLSYTPLFQAVFALDDAADARPAFSGVRTDVVETEWATSKFDLTLFLSSGADGLRATLEYSTDLFDRATVLRMMGHLERVLDQVASRPEARLSELTLLGEAERGLVVDAWNRTQAEYPAGRCIHQLFAEQAARTPDAVALVHETDSLTYAELNARANRLAHHLIGLGVGPEVRVGVCLERGLDLVVSLMAVLKAGGAYVPLDPAYPTERLRLTLSDASVAVLITQEKLRGLVTVEPGVAVVVKEQAQGEIAAKSAESPESGATPRNLAYLIYTSGSTGVPKGVAIEHESAVVMMAWAWGVYSADDFAGMLASTSISFDMSVYELFATLTCGGRVIVVENALALPRSAAADQVRLLDTVPSAAAALLKTGGIPSTVRTVNLGGEPLKAELVDALYAHGVERVYDMYGPSEDTTFSTYALREPGGPVTIGRILSNSQAYVVDNALQPLPVGVPGELYLGGKGVTRGYLGRPGLTAGRYVPDPFSSEPGARMYRTGDRIRWKADGTLEYLGRFDHQVKIRGFRVEVGEIEAVLRRDPAVTDCVVLARADEAETRLVAYVVGDAEADALRAHVKRSVPDYMVPAAFVFLDALPLTPNGKLDRKALPAPEFGSGADAYVAPRTRTEEVLAGIWADVLRVDRISAEESFFALGGHSLLATRVVSAIREVLDVELPLRAIFETPVLSALAAEVERLRGEGAAADGGPIAPAERGGDLPVTFAQERLWFVDALDPGSPVYALPFSYRIAGALDEDALRRAIAELVRRHEPLRTTLPSVAGVPVQRIAPPPSTVDLPVADLRQLPRDARAAEADRLVAAAAAHRFDLAHGPLFRAELVRVDDAEHLLLLNIHHAVGDGWSLGVLLEEISALYGAFSRGEPSPLPVPALQYADYAVWQRQRLSGAALERQVAFWRRTLDGAPALLELPTDRPRPPVESHRGAVEQLTVPAGLADSIHALAQREGATLFMVLLAALDVVLGRLSGQDDVVVGTPIAGRTRAETDRMVGLFLNSLALRTDLAGDPTFRELLARVRETTLAAYAHQDLPFERLLEELRPERSLAHAPVFQVMLNLLNFEGGALRGGGLEVTELDGFVDVTSKFDLTLYVGQRDGGIDVHLVYAADLFDAPRMREMLAQLQGVLRQAADAPETRVGALSLATDAARAVLPDPAAALDERWRGAVHEVFAARAAETPDALAVEDPRERWTYAELDAATDAIARRLAGHGVGTGDVVAITGHRSAALVRALLGTMKSGAAFLVLDPSYPAARLAEYVRIARPAAHLHLPAAGTLPREVADLLVESIRTHVVIRPRGDDAAAEMDAGEPLRVEVGPDTLAYLSFTSGTTGTPKAVMGRHSALTHFTPWLASEFGLTSADRYSLLSGLAHDPLHRDVFTPLQLGAAVVAPEPDETGTPGYLARWMREAGITVAHLTPAMGQLLADADDGERIDSLRRAFFVGDVLRRADVQRLTALAPNLHVVNYYGSTETQRAVSWHDVDPSTEQKEIIPLGRGIPGVQLLVCNAAGALAGIGEVGEIWLRSPHLAAGYLGDEALSASRFVVNPWTGAPRDRLYRTGDLGRYRPDGEVEPMGRADQQVKVRGFRVELGEVESALAAHEAVKEAAVIAREAEGGDRRLVAYWVPAVEGAGGPASAALRTHLKSLLPEYMVPSAYVRLERLPLTANGKLDRRALPEPEISAAETQSVAPRTPTEELLAQVWAEILRVDSVGVEDDFFALGGHSLLATRLLARVQNALGVVLPLRAIFEGPTVAALAQRVEEIRRAGLPALPPVAPVDRDGPLPLSSAQERLWFLDRLEGGSAFYNLPAALRLSGALDAPALERALGEIVRRHESLRTTFREVEGGAVQVIAPFTGFALPVDDLSGLDDAAREAEVTRRATENASRPFDLVAGPLFRAALLRLGAEEHVLLLCIHHIVSDGWSTGVLLREMSALYETYKNGAESQLPPLPVQYADYAVWQREQLRGEALERQIGYWKDRLAGAPALLELPTDRPRPPVQSHRGARETFTLPGELLDRLQALGRGEGATLYMVMLSAFQALLSKYSGSEDVVVGSPIAGRTRHEVEALIGFFANTLVMRTDLGGDPAFRELLARVRETTLGAYEHQEVPFERLVAELQPERSMSHAPLFQVLFTLQNADRTGFELPGLRMEGVAAEVATTRFDLSLTVIPDTDTIHGVLEYSTDLFERDAVLRMLGHLERVLEQVVARPEARLSELELLSAEERSLVVDEWNATEQAYDDERRIDRLIGAQAARTPDAVAVVFDDEPLTYRELDLRANRLANHLAALGVGPEARVGICLERSLEMVVAMLGVLKAGAAYLPLDPRYPADRLAYMLEDSGARVLVTEASLRGLLPADGVRIVQVDADADSIAAESADAPRRALDARNTAYVIYTSGSTGRPKGVQVTHGNAASFFAAMDGRVGGQIPGTWLAVTRISFDIHVLELLWTLARGFKVIVHPDVEQAREDVTIERQIRRHGVTHLQCTPSLAAMLIAESGVGALAGLQRLLLGGEALPADLAARITGVLPGGLINMYGPTETTVWSATHAVEGEGGSVPIGRPIANTRVYVLDAALHPTPAGVPGELYVGGAGVTRGYLNRPGLTAERFVPDPFGAEPGGRLYRTGDRARWREQSAGVRKCVSAEVSGSADSRTDALTHSRTAVLEYLDRLDAQVKVRGFRIEPGEIEAALRRHPEVAECAVVARGAAGARRLVAYVVGGAQPDALRAHLRGSLPDYMVPEAFVALDALPLTPNGKLDRRALPEPAAAEDRYVAPRTPAEEMVAGVWADVLGVERVGAEDSFFALGGHSLLAMRVVSRIREALGVELPLRAMFEQPTVAALAAAAEKVRRAGAPPLSPVVPVGRGAALPLSFAQERLWVLDRLEPGSTVYSVPAALRLRGALDAAALERALGEIVRRHEALRTTFREADGGPVQVIAPFDGFAMAAEDLSALDDVAREAMVRRRVAEDVARPFDLVTGPLFRAALLRLGAQEHVLLLSMHHVVSDAWSLGVLFREMSALYGAYVDGRESPLPALAVQYADYAVWQRERLQGEALDGELAYWKDRLAGAPALLELPIDHPRPAVQTYRGATERVELSAALLERLQAVARGEGATLYMVLLAAFQVLLSKYSGSEDVVVGSPIAGRTRREVEGLIGIFINTLVLRTDLGGDPAFRELLRRVRQTTLGAYEHQDLPFEKLVAELQPERSLSHAPIFQVMFTLQDGGELEGGLPGVRFEGVETEFGAAKVDLSLTLTPTSAGLAGGMVYSTDLFDRATIQRMLGHLERVLEQVADDADTRISALELLSAKERSLVVDAWNATEQAYDAERRIDRLIGAQAARTPDAVAVVFDDEPLTYRELDERANRLANHLVELGVGPEARVGICLERSAGMVVAMLAVLKAGAAYLPLDPRYPADRLAYMLEDSGARVLVTEASLRELLPADGVRIVSVDSDAAAIAAESADAPRTALDARNTAYVIYTSGSTGRPKGVQVTHGNAASFFAAMDGRVGGKIPGTWLAVTRISFDIHVLELLWTLARGFRVIVHPDVEQAREDVTIERQIRRHGVTHLQCTPSLAAMLIAESGVGALAGLQRLLLGGEALPADLAARITGVLPGGLINMYGPTETTVWSATHEVEGEGGSVPIGRPIANTRVYVLDAALHPTPAGVPGELYVGGAGVTRGYLNRPGLTAERFVPDPFGAEPGGRLYRTGDRARWREQSAEVRECGSAEVETTHAPTHSRTDALTHSRTAVLEYLDRLDAQVKVRGFRIEPGEIEAALRRHPEVAECAVVARGAAGARRLVAYVVGGAQPDALRAHLRGSLPDYMVPEAFVALDALPLTPNGKLDRKALPEPEFGSAAAYVAPRTPVEEVLAEIWSDVLGLERVGVEESFFDLGGHSLLATRVVSRVRAVLGVELPLRALFEEPTVAALARAVEEIRRAGVPVLPPVLPVERTGALPLSFAQERLWFLDRMETGSAFYNIPAAVRFSGAMDVGAMERALGEIVRRHEALRTVFREVDGVPTQVIVPFAGFALPIDDLSATDDVAREAMVHRRATDDAARPFDLVNGPVFRASLLRLGAEEHVLLLCVHHIASDGWSMGVLFRELSALYAAYTEGGASPLPELAVQYADYAAWQRAHLQGEALDRQMAYWKQRLAGVPALLELPTDHPRPAVQTHHGAIERVQLSAGLLERLRGLGRGEGATLYMVLLGAFQVLLSKYTGSEDVVVGSPIAGRTRAEVEGLIGFFVNTLVLRTGLDGDPSFREVLRRVRAATLGAYEHQDVPFEKLVAELQPERSMSHSPLFQVMFQMEDAAAGTESGLPGLRAAGVNAELDAAKVDLNLALTAVDGGLRGGIIYSTDLFDRVTIQRMLGHLERVLEQVAADPGARISQLDLLSAGERALVVDEWNRTAADYPADLSIHQMVEAQAARTPDAVAVVFGDDSLTHRQVDERANRLANHLIGLGVGPETRVGICLERSAGMVAALLGVLKAGAAYLPLDPSYPADRLAYMLEDSGATVLVTQTSLRGLLPTEGVRIVAVDEDAEAIASASTAPPRTAMDPDNTAYIIYTSGSTGRPKGVQVSHANAGAFFAAMDGRVGGTMPGVWLAVTRISFDLHVVELLWTLSRGFRVIVQPEVEQARENGSIAAQIRRHGITHLQCTPALITLLIAESGIQALAGLERVFLGGEALPAALAARIDEVVPGGLVNMYGPTETTVWCTTHVVESAAGSIPIGRPVDNMRMYVVDAALSPVPVGVPGELYIGGTGVTRGYLNRPGLSADRFIPDPFAARPGGRLYRTGDRVRWRRDGTLEYLGRVDFQVKVRGFRIELGEIEAALRLHPGVEHCAVVARDDASGEKRLVAYFAGGAGADALREHLRGSLPDYMVPSAMVAMDALPLTPNGKVDRRALPAPEFGSAGAYVAPRTPVEEVLAEIWGEVLEVERVGVEETFFALGGHSLLVMRVVSRIREIFGVELPLRTFFDQGTVGQMAALLATDPRYAESTARVLALLMEMDEEEEEELSPGALG